MSANLRVFLMLLLGVAGYSWWYYQPPDTRLPTLPLSPPLAIANPFNPLRIPADWWSAQLPEGTSVIVGCANCSGGMAQVDEADYQPWVFDAKGRMRLKDAGAFDHIVIEHNIFDYTP